MFFEIFWQLCLVISGLYLLGKGADKLVDGSSDIAQSFGISPTVIGLTLVAFGTSLPEITTTVMAVLQEGEAAKSAADLAVGNIIGSNISNIALVLGLSLFIKPMSKLLKAMKVETVMMLLVGFLFMAFALTDSLDFISGAVFITIFLIFQIYIIIGVSKTLKQDETEKKQFSLVSLWLCIFGLVLLMTGADILISSAVKVAGIAGLSSGFIGLSIVALGTSLPELATSIAAVRKSEYEMAFANVLGSNFLNVSLAIGIPALIVKLNFNKDQLSLDIVFMFVLMLLIAPAAFGKQKPGKIYAGFLLLLYGLYIAGIALRESL